MTIKGKDFKKAVEFIKDFLSKLPQDTECAELRDSLNLTLLHMKKYFKTVWLLNQEKSQKKNDKLLSASLPRDGTHSPFHHVGMDQFQWKWVNFEPPKVVTGSLPIDGGEIPRLPLILQASKEGDNELIRQLIDKDPSCANAKDKLGRSAIMYAVHFGSDDCLETLLSRGASVNDCSEDGITAAHIATLHDDIHNLRRLLDHKADVTKQDSFGRTAVHWAASLPSDECLKVLIKCNIPLNTRDKEGLTPAMWACHYDRKRNFETLLNVESYKIPDEDGIERDKRGRTWIHWSVNSQAHGWSHDCLKSLLTTETAAIKDSNGKTALHLAAEIGALEACKFLLSEENAPSIVNMTDNQARTCLHLATLAGHGEVANFLLEKGVDLNLKDHLGNTALDYCHKKELHYCSMILRSHQNIQEFRERKQKRHQLKNQKNIEVNNNSKPLPSLSTQDPHPSQNTSSERSLPMFNSVPTPRPGLSPRTSNLTRVEDLDLDDEEVQEAGNGNAEMTGVGGTISTTSEKKEKEENQPLQENESPEVVQYVTENGEIVQSAESGIINCDMQPSSQHDEEAGKISNGDIAQPAASSNPDSMASNNSLDFGMDVSDIEENNNDEERGRLEGKSLEMIPPDLVVQPPYNPEMTSQRSGVVPRPPESKVSPRSGNGSQVPHFNGIPQPPSKSGDHQGTTSSHVTESHACSASPGRAQQPQQPPSPRRLTPLSGESSILPNVKGEVKSKKKKKKKSPGLGPSTLSTGPNKLSTDYLGGHPAVRPASPSFPLPPPRTPSPRTPLTRGRPERPSTPPPASAPSVPSYATCQQKAGTWEGSWEPKRPGSPSPPVTPRDQRGSSKDTTGQGGSQPPSGLYPAVKGPQGSMKMTLSPRSQGLLNPMRPPSPRSPAAPLTPKMPPDRGQTKSQPFLPAPPGRPSGGLH